MRRLRVLLPVVVLAALSCSADGSQRFDDSAKPRPVVREDLDALPQNRVDVVNESADAELASPESHGEAAEEMAVTDSLSLAELTKRPLAEGAATDRMDWREAVQWWAGTSYLLKAEWLPGGAPTDESIYGYDYSEADDSRSLVVAYTYDERTPTTHPLRDIVDAGAVIARVGYVPPGEQPAWAHPVWTTKVVEVRGHPAKLFEARRSEGANVDFRVIYWEEPSPSNPGAQVQFEFEVHPDFYTEDEHVTLIDRKVVVGE